VCLDSGPNLLDVVGPQQPDTEGLHSRRRRAPDTPWCAFSAAAYSSAPPSVPNTPPELCSHRLPVDLLDSGWMKAPRARAPRLTPRFPRLRGAGHTECHTASTTYCGAGLTRRPRPRPLPPERAQVTRPLTNLSAHPSASGTTLASCRRA
jgi:hypothetical protein